MTTDNRPATMPELASVVTRLFLGWPSMRGVEAETIAEMVRAYAEAMQGVPLWAAQEAAANCRSGRVAFNTEFAPSAATLATEARRLWNDAMAKEAASRPKLMPPSYAEGLSPEQRAEKAAKLRAMIAEATRPMVKAAAPDEDAA